MPQIGHSPGADAFESGCIGQAYCTAVLDSEPASLLVKKKADTAAPAANTKRSILPAITSGEDRVVKGPSEVASGV